MTPTEQIQTQLEHGPAGGGGAIHAGDRDVEVRVRLADWDRLGCLLERLELQHTKGQPLRIAPPAIADTITYLGESLRVIETEEARGRAILRSGRPIVRGGKPEYFEVILDPTPGLTLSRYAYDSERGERVAIAAPLTRQALERLVEDLLSLAAGGLSLTRGVLHRTA